MYLAECTLILLITTSIFSRDSVWFPTNSHIDSANNITINVKQQSHQIHSSKLIYYYKYLPSLNKWIVFILQAQQYVNTSRLFDKFLCSRASKITRFTNNKLVKKDRWVILLSFQVKNETSLCLLQIGAIKITGTYIFFS